ncbi:hypothetical protein J6590_074280 [Homalodisca vitripennis]|nr:hypothetical protein J6590_074280 [Homalodisca vitripennis]
MIWLQRLSLDNLIKQRRAWLPFGCATAERSCPCKQPSCPAIGGGSEVTFKLLVPRLDSWNLEPRSSSRSIKVDDEEAQHEQFTPFRH